MNGVLWFALLCLPGLALAGVVNILKAFPKDDRCEVDRMLATYVKCRDFDSYIIVDNVEECREVCRKDNLCKAASVTTTHCYLCGVGDYEDTLSSSKWTSFIKHCQSEFDESSVAKARQVEAILDAIQMKSTLEQSQLFDEHPLEHEKHDIHVNPTTNDPKDVLKGEISPNSVLLAAIDKLKIEDLLTDISPEEGKTSTVKPEKQEVKPEKQEVKPEKQEIKPEKQEVKPEKQEVKPEKQEVKLKKQEVKPKKQEVKPENKTGVYKPPLQSGITFKKLEDSLENTKNETEIKNAESVTKENKETDKEHTKSEENKTKDDDKETKKSAENKKKGTHKESTKSEENKKNKDVKENTKSDKNENKETNMEGKKSEENKMKDADKKNTTSENNEKKEADKVTTKSEENKEKETHKEIAKSEEKNKLDKESQKEGEHKKKEVNKGSTKLAENQKKETDNENKNKNAKAQVNVTKDEDNKIAKEKANVTKEKENVTKETPEKNTNAQSNVTEEANTTKTTYQVNVTKESDSKNTKSQTNVTEETEVKKTKPAVNEEKKGENKHTKDTKDVVKVKKEEEDETKLFSKFEVVDKAKVQHEDDKLIVEDDSPEPGVKKLTPSERNNCYVGKAENYRGTISVTRLGLTCQRWDSQKPHTHGKYTTPMEFIDDKMPENYCRTALGEHHTPWCFTTKDWKRWDYCDIKRCKDSANPGLKLQKAEISHCYIDKPSDYHGTVDKTKHGVTCQRWDSQYPHAHKKYRSGEEFIDGRLPDNYCRTALGEHHKPWCYTTEKGTRWDYCDIKQCKAAKSRPPVHHNSNICYVGEAFHYRGNISVTSKGHTCQRWDSQAPHTHRSYRTPDVFIDDRLPENFCRTALGEHHTPWCYTTDPNTRWDYCDIKECAGISHEKSKTAKLAKVPAYLPPNITQTGENLCYVGKSYHYRGTVATTHTGFICQRWDRQTPHRHKHYTHGSEFVDKVMPDNFCRGVMAENITPWCYTTNPRKRWDFCDITNCIDKDCYVGKQSDYTGKVAQTSTGVKCQRWDRQKPHNHRAYSKPQEFKDNSISHNYCRTAIGDDYKPWCYTTDPNIRWDFCDITECKD